MDERSQKPPAVPQQLEDALGDALWRDPASRTERFEDLVRQYPEHEDALRARRAFLLDEDDVDLLGEAAVDHDLTGQILSGKYRILRLRGEGGFGSVYEAVDEMLGATVAVKVLHIGAAHDREMLRRFMGEAKLLTNLDHPNVVRWITFDRTDEDLHYFVMEFLSGEELSEILKRDRILAPERAVDMLLQITSALRAAHKLPDGSSLLHLDLKPQNVFVLKGDPERVKVIDFGISQHVGAEARAAAGIRLVGANSRREGLDLTATITSALDPDIPETEGRVQRARGGTLLYASPEQCRHLAGMPDIVELDGRSDIYSLGIMAFLMLSGEMPYVHKPTPIDALEAHMKQKPRTLSQVGVKVSRQLEAFVAKCLAKDRDDRFATIEEAHEALDRIANPPALWPKLVGAAVVLLSALVVFFAMKDDVPPFDVDLPGGVAYFGPERSTQALLVTNVVDASPGAAVEILADPSTEEPALADWSARVTDDMRAIELVAAEGTRTTSEQVYLRIAGAAQVSHPIRVAYLGAESWSIERAGVRGFEGGVLDPNGAELEVVLRGDAASIRRVEVGFDGRQLRAQRDGSLEVPTYRLDFHRLAGLPERGRVSLTTTVVGRARRSETREIEFELDARPLGFEARLDDATSIRSGEYLVYPDRRPVLRTTPNRSASFAVRAEDQEGTEIVLTERKLDDGIELGFPDREESYSGTLTIEGTDDVRHADPSRGRVSKKLQFLYAKDAPKLTVTADATSEHDVLYTKKSELTLSLQRSNEVLMTVDAVFRPGDGDEQVQRKLLHQDAGGDVRFALPSDGSYRVETRGYRHFVDAEIPDHPEVTQELLVVRDTTPPSLRMESAIEERLNGANADSLVADVFVSDVALEGVERLTPVALHWELRRADDSREIVRDAALPARSPSAQPRAIRWRDLEIDPQKDLVDGDYVFRVVGADVAGNRAQPVECRWSVGRHGPVLEYEKHEGSWKPLETNQFRVVVRVEDPNGVRRVRCTARDGRDAAREAITLELATTTPDSPDAEWSGAFSFPANWSERHVRLDFVAFDTFGNRKALEPKYRQLAKFEVARPRVVCLTRLDAEVADITRMRLVEGDSRYVFTGRNLLSERKTFEQFGMELPGDIHEDFSGREENVPSFYLDETEVTVGQFLAFVRAENGYCDPAHWTEGRAPSQSRRDELERRFAGVSRQDLPATSVDWYEASAYARWVGKRLPTLLEWEYAARGGRAYRPYSCGVAVAELDRAEFNVNLGKGDARRSAWVVGRGCDLTPSGVGAGIRGLCSNVTEWVRDVHEKDSRKRYAAGANFTDRSCHFRKRTGRRPEYRKDTIGFRCAMRVEDMDALFERRTGRRLDAHPLSEESR